MPHAISRVAALHRAIPALLVGSTLALAACRPDGAHATQHPDSSRAASGPSAALDSGLPPASARVPDAGAPAARTPRRRVIASSVAAFGRGGAGIFALSRDGDRWSLLQEQQSVLRSLVTFKPSIEPEAFAFAALPDGALFSALSIGATSSGVLYRLRDGRSDPVGGRGRTASSYLAVAGDDASIVGGTSSGALHRIDRRTNTIETVARGHFVRLVMAGATVYGVEQLVSNDPSRPLASYRVISLAPGARKPAEVGRGEGLVFGLAASDGAVAWTTIDGGKLPRESSSGSVWLRDASASSPRRLATGLACPMGVALDGAHAYVALRGTCRDAGGSDGGLARIALSDGAIATLADKVGAPSEIAVDDRSVYTTTESTFAIVAPYGVIGTPSVRGALVAFDKPAP